MDIKKLSSEKSRPQDVEEAVGEGEVLNAFGHKQELERNFSLLSICAIGITTGNVWAALGGSIVRPFFSFSLHVVATSTSTPTLHPPETALTSIHVLPLMRNSTTIQYANSSQVIALYNGGPAGVIYEFIAVSCCYFMIAACIAEMASAIPSSAGVYHWASVTAGARFGKVVGFYAGWYVHFAHAPTYKLLGKF
jgi:choline transport protein